MSAKRKIRMAIDLAMTMLLPVLMAYSLVGEEVHEWLGILMFLFFIIHHALNLGWHKNLVTGSYLPLRMLSAGINLLLVIVMVALSVSGILMAKNTFHFISFSSGTASVRLIHLLASYWGFLLMCLHLGFHWNMVLGIVRRVIHIKDSSLWKVWLLRIVGVSISIYGSYAFIRRGFTEYLFLKTQFVFFDFGEPLPIFFMDYIAVMILYVCVGHYMVKGLARLPQRKKAAD